jgi:hypothetical protein
MHIYIYIHACIRAQIYIPYAHTCIHTYIDTSGADKSIDTTRTHCDKNRYIHAFMHACTHTCIRVCTNTLTYLHTHTHMGQTRVSRHQKDLLRHGWVYAHKKTCMHILIHTGADKSIETPEGLTAAQMAKNMGHTCVVDILCMEQVHNRLYVCMYT